MLEQNPHFVPIFSGINPNVSQHIARIYEELFRLQNALQNLNEAVRASKHKIPINNAKIGNKVQVGSDYTQLFNPNLINLPVNTEHNLQNAKSTECLTKSYPSIKKKKSDRHMTKKIEKKNSNGKQK